MLLDPPFSEIEDLTDAEREQFEKIAQIPYNPPADEVIEAVRGGFLARGDYRPEYADQARRLCETMGATDRQLAAFFGVCELTILNWASRHGAFREAREQAKRAWDEKIVGALATRAMGYDKVTKSVKFTKDGTPVELEEVTHYPPDVKAIFIWLRNRMPNDWKDRREVVDPTKPADGDQPRMPRIELARKVLFMMQQATDEATGQPGGTMRMIEEKVTISDE